MTNDQIKKEYIKLFHARIEESTRCNYYYKQQLQVLQESNEWLKEWKSLKETEIPSSIEEQEKLYLKIREQEAKIDSAKEVDKFLSRMANKSRRKINEIDRQMELFCKRHGIENMLPHNF